MGDGYTEEQTFLMRLARMSTSDIENTKRKADKMFPPVYTPGVCNNTLVFPQDIMFDAITALHLERF